MSQKTESNPVLQRFKALGKTFNEKYLTTLNQIMDVHSEQDTDKEKEQFRVFALAYKRDYDCIAKDVNDHTVAFRIYDAVGDRYNLLMARDTQVFQVPSQEEEHGDDLLARMCDAPGADTCYTYEQLNDGSGDDLPEEQRDAKHNFWLALIGLYRLACVITVYTRTPVVKELIDLILTKHSDISQDNLFNKIAGDFKGSKQVRRLIKKMMDTSDGDNFSTIMTCLQRVIATFSDEVNLDKDMTRNVDQAKQRMREQIRSILEEVGMKEPSDECVEEAAVALDENDDKRLSKLVPNRSRRNKLQKLFKSKGLDSMNVGSVFKSLGQSMETMMEAIRNNDESKMEEVLSHTRGVNITAEELARMKSEFEEEEENGEEQEEQAAEPKAEPRIELVEEEDDDDEEPNMQTH